MAFISISIYSVSWEEVGRATFPTVGDVRARFDKDEFLHSPWEKAPCCCHVSSDSQPVIEAGVLKEMRCGF